VVFIPCPPVKKRNYLLKICDELVLVCLRWPCERAARDAFSREPNGRAATAVGRAADGPAAAGRAADGRAAPGAAHPHPPGPPCAALGAAPPPPNTTSAPTAAVPSTANFNPGKLCSHEILKS